MTYSPLYRSNSQNIPARKLQTTYQNASGTLLVQCTPVCTNSSGQAVTVDVTDETTVGRLIGLLSADLPVAAFGEVTDAGRMENVNLSFNVGDVLYVSKTGFLTNIKPDIGSNGFVEGDFVIFVGVVVTNQFNPSQKDLKLMLSVVGEL
jgi:hypothetical protein